MCRSQFLGRAALALAGLALAVAASAGPTQSGRASVSPLTTNINNTEGSLGGNLTPEMDQILGTFDAYTQTTLRAQIAVGDLDLEGLKKHVKIREMAQVQQLQGQDLLAPGSRDATRQRIERQGTDRINSVGRTGDSRRVPGTVPGEGGPIAPSGLGTGNCCAPGDGTPGCNDPACQTAVCAADPFCCSVAWDGLCAGAANAICAICAAGPAPANNDCADAELITVPGAYPGTTSGATIDGAGTDMPGCGQAVNSPSVWYEFVGTGNLVTVSTCTSDGGFSEYDSKLHVYCGDCADHFCVGANDDGGAGCNIPSGLPFASRVTFCSAPGTTYHVMVSGFGAFDSGDFVLSLVDGAPCTNPPICAPCIVDCPPGAVQENEPNCGLSPTGGDDFVNGGCNSAIGGSNCLVAHGTPGCDDPACQAAVCALDSFCCSVAWDGLCAGAAATLCPGLPPPVHPYTEIACGDTVCGSGAWNPAIGFRDTDWYRFTLDEAAAVHWTVNAEFAAQLIILADTCPAVVLFASTSLIPCTESTLSSGPLLPGTYVAFVAPLFLDAVPCPTEYTAHLECENLCGPSGGCSACELYALLRPLVPPGQQDDNDDHPCFGTPMPAVANPECCESVYAVLPLLPGVVEGTHPRVEPGHPCYAAP